MISIDDFNRTLEIWAQELKRYDYSQLCSKPSPRSWSIGQVYMHLLSETNWYMEQARACATSDENVQGESSIEAIRMFSHNEFPDEAIPGPQSNANTPQPESKEQLMSDWTDLTATVNRTWQIVLGSSHKGKTKHPGHHYLTAREWVQFAEMHMRHHLKQKRRVDDFLKIND